MAVTAVTSPNQQHGIFMLHRAHNDTSASQGGHTEAYPPKTLQWTIPTRQYRHVCQRRTTGPQDVVQSERPRQWHDEADRQQYRRPPERDLDNKVQQHGHHIDRPHYSHTRWESATAALGPSAAHIAPTITTHTESQDQSNRLNLN